MQSSPTQNAYQLPAIISVLFNTGACKLVQSYAVAYDLSGIAVLKYELLPYPANKKDVMQKGLLAVRDIVLSTCYLLERQTGNAYYANSCSFMLLCKLLP